MEGDRKMIWIPPEYWPDYGSSCIYHDGALYICEPSGKVQYMELTRDNSLTYEM